MDHPDHEAQRQDVDDVLVSLGLGEEGPPRLEAWNKIDLLGPDEREALLNEAARRDDVVAISAVTGDGLDRLQKRIGELLTKDDQVVEISVPSGDGSRIAWLLPRRSPRPAIERRGDPLVGAVLARRARFQASSRHEP